MSARETTDTFHHPCHACGQSIDVSGGTSQPHECRTYDTDAERICAAYWAGYDRATGVNDGRGDLFPPSGADDAPDESKGLPTLLQWLYHFAPNKGI